MSPSRGFPWRSNVHRVFLTCPRPQSLPRALLRPSPSTTRSFSVIEGSIGAAHTVITSLHSFTGLPWYATIPLFAITLRTAIILPLNLVGQRNRQQRAKLTPQLQEARPAIEREVLAKYNHLGPEKCTKILSRKLVEKRSELQKEAGISTWPGWLPWGQFPIWLVAIETVRRMCGAKEGLLGMLVGRGAESNAASAVSEASGVRESGYESAADLADAGGVSLNLATHYNPLYEPSFELEGCLWFQNLVMPDPELALPFILSAVMLTNIMWEDRIIKKAGIRRPRWMRILMNSLKIVALSIGPLTLNMPAAVHVYWLASATTALAQKRIADMIYPIPRPPPMPEVTKITPDGKVVAEKPAAPKRYVPIKTRRRR